ncbi:MAG: DUF362 domain-containing protein [Methanobacteriota archaeon]
MKNVVFFTNQQRLHDALEYFPLDGFFGKRVPVKLHMGEMRNKYYVKPDFVRDVIKELKGKHVEPFLHDTTVAYPGLRRSKTGYLKLAHVHGFTLEKVGCPVVIDDTGVPTLVEGRTYDVATQLASATHIVALSHVKGHIQTGMGGAIKNFGMGGVTRETKIRIHDRSRPVYQKDSCTFCGVCAERCPFQAIKVREGSLKISTRACFGCGVCVDVCKTKSLRFSDADIQYLLACSAKACLQGKNVLYLNELKRIARGCDCDPFAGPIICPDIGYLLSDDPVAIDKASLDRINQVKEHVFEKENKVDPFKQIKYGEDIGLGSSSYQLIEL